MKPNSKISAAVAAILWAPGASVVFAAPAETTSGAAAAVELAEVVVTAQRRAESVQNVPITIQALTGDSLAQMTITTFDDVIKLLPNVTFSANGPGQGNIYMRGLSVGFAGSQSSASINPFANVPTTFTRNRNPNVDAGPNAYSSSYPAHLDTFNNYNIVKRAQNPTTYQGFRLAGLYQFNDEWNVLIQQTYQSLDAEGMPVQFPSSMEFTPAGAPIPLQPLQETSFMPAWNKDKAETTAWTVDGRIADLRAI